MGDPLSGGDAVQCHTDIQPCCNEAEMGIRTGDWYFPDGERVPSSADSTADIHMVRTVQRVDPRRRDDELSPSGIYTCEIQVNGDDNNPERESQSMWEYMAVEVCIFSIVLGMSISE